MRNGITEKYRIEGINMIFKEHSDNMRQVITLLLLIILSISKNTSLAAQKEPRGKDNVAYKWGKMALDATANDTDRFKPRPTITSRYLGLIFTSIFDAWTRYDEKASPVYLHDVERRPTAEMTLENKEIAISYAAYRAMSAYYYSDSLLYKELMRSLGLDPENDSLDPNTPIGIGNLAAKAVIAARKNDGSNEFGELSDGNAYTDYSNYFPINNADSMVDINKWQPKYFSDGQGGTYAPACLTPYWQSVKPLLIDSASQFRPGPPPLVGSDQLADEVREVIELQANLTDENRALVEFMRDGPSLCSRQVTGCYLLKMSLCVININLMTM